MADLEQLAVIREGVGVWNKWRQEHPDARIDLSNVFITYANLDNANLTGGDLEYADLSWANLMAASLMGANFKVRTWTSPWGARHQGCP